jgi:DNA-binding CsgD family transcriptional regulator
MEAHALNPSAGSALAGRSPLLRLLSEGHNYKTAAVALKVSVNTIATHMRHVYEKLQVHSKSEAVAKALRNRLVKVVAAAEPPAPAVDANGLPRVLSTALAGNRVVVIGLHDPDSALDQMALAEAREGARAAGAGFVAINVFAEAQSRPLLELLGALENPGILVYRRPDVLFARMSGFADSETVAQAAANARR